MRNSKIVALVAATALLVLGAAFTAFAATGWVEDAGSWHYYDKNGDMVTEKFEKSGDNWYYLDADGNMATEALIEYNSNWYWVDGSGKMVTNQWVKVPNTDGDEKYGDYIYYYFQSSGKAYRCTDTSTAECVVKTINNKKYAFDEAGKMRYGWLDAGYKWSSADEGKEYESGLYYCGGADDGARVTSKWVKLNIVNADNDDVQKWFYFDNKGEKVANVADKKINGKKYAFDADGVMLYEWAFTATNVTTDSANISAYGWFQDAENGSKKVKGWIKQIPQAKVDKTENEAETAYWFYADKNGNFYKSAIKSINGKSYGFNDKGEMVSGLQYVTRATDSEGNDLYTFKAIDESNVALYTSITDKVDADGVPYILGADLAEKTGVRFFSADGDNDGSMKTGSVKVTVDGDEYNFKFATKGVNKGIGKTGKDGNYYYLNGCKIVADSDLRVQAFHYAKLNPADESTWRIDEVKKAAKTAVVGVDYYEDCALLTSSGSIVKSGTKTDGDGFKFRVSDYVITEVTYEN